MKAFGRSLLVFAAIQAAMANAMGRAIDWTRREFQYSSRGKGRGSASRKYNSSGKYMPHQGKREIARRARQIESGFLKVI